MGLYQLVRTRQYRNFMAKLYGLGASVVIIGALFKINHYPGADYMLIIGLGTESIIFFFSAFEPPHVEPDWSLVYPQLAGMYHGGDVGKKELESGEDVIRELDNMLAQAKIGPELIQSLGDGLRNLDKTASQLSDVSNTALVNDHFVSSLESATQSASVLSESYKKSAQTMEQSVSVSQEQIQSFQAVSRGAADLSAAYSQVSESMREEINTGKTFVNNMKDAADSASAFVNTYNESAEYLAKTAETLHASASEGSNYNDQLKKISQNLSALNALYELHIQSSNEQMNVTNKANETLGTLISNVSETTTNTVKFKETLDSLNKVFEKQLAGTSEQVETGMQMQESMQMFLANLSDSVEKTAKFKNEVDELAKNIAALNRVYGNMLSAMNVTIK